MSQGYYLKNMVEDVLSSYENRIKSLGSIFDITYRFLNETQESLVNARDEREKINTQIRDILAKKEHLRRKDFNNMMEGILLAQEKREKDVRNLLKGYFSDQKDMAQSLRKNLEEFRDSLAKGEGQRTKGFQALIKDILFIQEERKREVVSKLKDFQREQGDLALGLKDLLAKGDNLRIRDFKLMLKKFNVQYKERLALQKERRGKVTKMLADFKKERKNAASSLKAISSARKNSLSQAKLSNGVNIDINDRQRQLRVV